MVVWCPDWPVMAQVADEPAGTAVAVFDKGMVLACNPAARADGVRRGMRRRDAQSRCPSLIVADHRPEADARAFEDVLVAIEELSPGVAPLRPGLCALRVSSGFYGGETEAAAVLAERLVDLGVWDVRLGVADGLFAAEQAARRALAQDVFIVPVGESAAFLADLPIEALDAWGHLPLAQRVGDDAVSLLRRMGLTTLGAFARLAPADVHTRFGRHGALLHRYARGLDPHPISRRAVPPELTASLVLEPPLELVDPIAFSLRTTAERFVADLAAYGLVCTTVRIEVDSEARVGSVRSWMHPRWFGATDLIDRLRWQLASGIPGAVDAVRLIPEVVEPLSDHADSLFGFAGGTSRSRSDWETADRVVRGIARVQGMVGHEGVLAVGVQGGRGPADRTLTAPWGEQPAVVRPVERPPLAGASVPAGGTPTWPGRIPAPAPATVFARPAEALVVGAEGQPVAVTGRGSITCPPERFRPSADAAWQPVASWAGPWPIEELWWDETVGRRIARFQVVGANGSAWLMVVENGRWFTEAQYD